MSNPSAIVHESEFMKAPAVSVCVPAYNHESYVAQAIQSVLDQTFTDWELIIVDDASEDGTARVCREFADRYSGRIRLIELENNGGPSSALNRTLKEAKGRYIAFHSSDDRMKPNRLQRQIEYLETHQHVGMVVSLVEYIDSEGNPVHYTNDIFGVPIHNLREQLLRGNFLNAPSATLRRDVVETTGSFNPELLYVQDQDYWMRVLDRYEITRLEVPLVEYRVHGENLSVQTTARRIGTLYETGLVSVRASERWDVELIYGAYGGTDVRARSRYIAESKVRIGQTLIDLDRHLFGGPLIAAGRAYALALEALELTHDSDKVQKFVSDIYQLLGDTTRAETGQSMTVSQWKLNRLNSLGKDVGGQLLAARDDAESYTSTIERYLAIADSVHKLTGEDLIAVTRRIVNNADAADADELRLEERELFYRVAKRVLEAAVEDKGGTRELMERSDLGSVADALGMLKEILDKDAENDRVKALYERFEGHDEDARYQRWIKLHALQEVDGQIFAERMVLKWSHKPEIHIVMFVFPGEQTLLADTLDSINAQFYKKWRLTVISDRPSPSPVFDEFETLEWRQLGAEDDPYEVANQRIRAAAADWVTFTWPGVQWEPHAFLRFGDYINLNADWQMIYTDDDKIDEDGNRSDVRFKPDFNLDLLRSMPYFGEACAFRRSAVEAIGGFDALPSGENYQSALKILDQFGESAIGHISDVLVHMPQATHRTENLRANRESLKKHFERNQIVVTIEDGQIPGTFRVGYEHASQPLVSIIIPTRDKIEFLRPCVESLFEKTTYPNFEVIIVDNQTVDPDALAYLNKIKQTYADRITVMRYPKPFNYAAISNIAAGHARGDYLLFLNNDTETVQPNWLSRLMMHGLRPEVGIVGPRLVYPENGRVQHVGVVLGLNGVAEHPYNNLLPLRDPGQMGRAQVVQNYSAVTGACLLIRRTIYDAVDGMDETDFAVSYNDIDLCLKVTSKGYKVVWTPFATLVHHSNVTQKSEFRDRVKSLESHQRFRCETEGMLRKWLPRLANDPAYNRNLSLSVTDFRVDTAFPINWDPNFHDRPRVFGFPLPSGAGDYRVTQPLMALSKAGRAQCEYARFPRHVSREMSVVEMARMQPDVVIFHQTLNDHQLDSLEQYETFNPNVYRIFTIDDLISQVPEKSSAYKNIMAGYRDAKTRLRKALGHCDRFIASTKPLADLCVDMIDDIQVIPICLEKSAWLHLKSKRGEGNKPRVGWAGAQQHRGDLEQIVEVVKATADEIDWVFFGMCLDEFRPYVKEHHEFVPLEEYPEKLASLNLDLAVAPLEIHPFNESKSDLRLLEYGILAWPVICTDIYPYRVAPVTRLSNTPELWIKTIREKVADPVALAKEGDRLREWVVSNRILEDRLDQWFQALMPPVEASNQATCSVSSNHLAGQYAG